MDYHKIYYKIFNDFFKEIWREFQGDTEKSQHLD